jgi:hypothetical protein
VRQPGGLLFHPDMNNLPLQLFAPRTTWRGSIFGMILRNNQSSSPGVCKNPMRQPGVV